jgi:hypothetical protein
MNGFNERLIFILNNKTRIQLLSKQKKFLRNSKYDLI